MSIKYKKSNVKALRLKFLSALNKMLPKYNRVLIIGFPNVESSAVATANYIASHYDIPVSYAISKKQQDHPGGMLESKVKVIPSNGTYQAQLRFFWQLFTSKYLFLTHGIFLSSFSKKQVVTNIWHGILYKKIGLLIGGRAIPAHVTVGTSPLTRKMFSEAFGVPESKVFVSGYPRNDQLLEGKANKTAIREQLDAGPQHHQHQGLEHLKNEKLQSNKNSGLHLEEHQDLEHLKNPGLRPDKNRGLQYDNEAGPQHHQSLEHLKNEELQSNKNSGLQLEKHQGPERLKNEALQPDNNSKLKLDKNEGLEQHKDQGFQQPRHQDLEHLKNEKLQHEKHQGPQHPKNKLNHYKKVLIWMPTFRKNTKKAGWQDGIESGNPFYIADFDVVRFNQILRENNSFCLVKPHPMAVKYAATDNLSHMAFIDDQWISDRGVTLYQLVGSTDILISDVSSVVIDYLLLDQPILCVSTDFETYKKNRGFYFEAIEEWLPGPVLRSEEMFFEALEAVLKSGRGDYDCKRKTLKERFFTHHDARSTERLVEYVFNYPIK